MTTERSPRPTSNGATRLTTSGWRGGDGRHQDCDANGCIDFDDQTATTITDNVNEYDYDGDGCIDFDNVFECSGEET